MRFVVTIALLAIIAAACSPSLVVSAPTVNTEPESLEIPVNAVIDDSWTLTIDNLHGWENSIGFLWGSQPTCVGTIEATKNDGSVYEGSRYSSWYQLSSNYYVEIDGAGSVVVDPVMAPGCQMQLVSVTVGHTDLGGFAHGPYPRSVQAGWTSSVYVRSPIASTNGPVAGHWDDAINAWSASWLPAGNVTAEFTWPTGTTSCPYEIQAFVNGSFEDAVIRPAATGPLAGDAPVQLDFTVPTAGDPVTFQFDVDSGSCQQWRESPMVQFTYS